MIIGATISSKKYVFVSCNNNPNVVSNKNNYINCKHCAIFCIMHSASILLVFPNSMFTPFLFCFYFIHERAMCSLVK